MEPHTDAGFDWSLIFTLSCFPPIPCLLPGQQCFSAGELCDQMKQDWLEDQCGFLGHDCESAVIELTLIVCTKQQTGILLKKSNSMLTTMLVFASCLFIRCLLF